ncbi:hypothetical protein MKX53_17625 [Psychrobacillus sp. FSL K6-4615]|uniref:hypothetical protein n=1 Tax=Psychrobacillus sp. FSL K6-4615 TaxID=2921551 RepID=UPI0030FB56BA
MKPLISAQELFEMEQRTKTLKAIIPNAIEEYAVQARLKREKFNALTYEGFTQEQAMQIIVANKEKITL